MRALKTEDIERARSGDELARAGVVAAYGPAVWGLCRRLAREPEDAYQESWIRVFRGLSGFEPAGSASLRTWILTVTHRTLVDLHRRRTVRGAVLAMPQVPVDPAPDHAIDARRRQQRLERALTLLPMNQRRVIVLHHLEGVSVEDIAATEQIAVGTVKSRLHRARARLLQLLGGAS